MKTEKYKKLSKGRYKVTFDKGSEYILYDNVILKYNLLSKKDISLNELDDILKENEFYDIYNVALNYIERRLRSEKELISYLEEKFENKKVIEEVVLLISEKGFLNDDVYISSFVNDKLSFTNYGPYKILNMLCSAGIDEDKSKNYIDSIDYDIWISRVKKIIEKRKKLNNKISQTMFIRKTTEYLISIGYEKNMFIEYFERDNQEDEETIMKEYELLVKKLSKKYEGNKLNFEIKGRLYKKGYSMDLINRILN